MRGFLSLVGVLVSTTLLAGAASAQDFLSFGYTDLNGSFNAGSMLFSAVDDGDTSGDVTRKVSPTGTAYFVGTMADGGFSGVAAFDLQMTLTGLSSSAATVNPGSGTIILTDLDGDTITAGVSGAWSILSGSGHFNGVLTDVFLNDNPTADDSFNGTDGSSIGMTFPGSQPFHGNIITLSFGNWFTDGLGTPQNFSTATTLAAGAIVPEPATIALLLVGGLVAALRRRASR